jgi:hypothetical protein
MVASKRSNRRNYAMRKSRPARQTIQEVLTVVLTRDVATGVAVSENWTIAGTTKPHRADGPASVQRDPETGIVVHELWCLNGQIHRVGGPANILRNRVTGRVYCSEWAEDGVKIKRPRPTRPARTESKSSDDTSAGKTTSRKTEPRLG